MPARATRIFVVTEEAPRVGLVFDTPSWWDLDGLFRTFGERNIPIPERGEVLFLDWAQVMTVDRETGRRRWDLPEGASTSEGRLPAGDVPDLVQEAEWLIVDRERVWVVPEGSRAGCVVFPAPIWWTDTYGDEQVDAWRRAFWRSHREGRTFDESNPWWADEASLFLGPEIAAFDRRMGEAYEVRHRREGRSIPSQHRRLMTQVAHTLEGAVWVVVFDYEWESGLG